MNRRKLADRFTSSERWKTFVVEAHHDGDPAGLLVDAFGQAQVREGEDVHIHDVDGEAAFVVDHLDNRFWNFHTTVPNDVAIPRLKSVIEARRDLDWMWLPSDHLRKVWPGSRPQWLATDYSDQRLSVPDEIVDLNLRVKGRAADEVIGLLQGRFGGTLSFSSVGFEIEDPDLGHMAEIVNRDGRFVAKGEDFAVHQLVVRRVVDRYRRFVEDIEFHALRWDALPGGGATLTGAPVVIGFSRPITDMDRFLGNLFSAKEPFRLWGVPHMTGQESAEIEAVDLHVGHQLRFDVTPNFMRVYLFEGGCGNSVARLAANLQHHFDGALHMVDSGLDELLKEPA